MESLMDALFSKLRGFNMKKRVTIPNDSDIEEKFEKSLDKVRKKIKEIRRYKHASEWRK